MQVSYTLALHPAQHLIDVTIDVAQVNATHVDFALPAWTPGSYLIREYARHVQEVSATAGDQPAAWRKLDKHTWRVATNGANQIRFTYRVYGHELTVRTNHVDDSHAHIVPAATFMAVAGATEQPMTLNVLPPDGWQVATGLTPAGTRGPGSGVRDQGLENTETRGHGDTGTGNGEQANKEQANRVQASMHHRYTAQDYDHLIDSPLEIGAHRVLAFEVDGKPHRIVIWGRGNEDEARLIADTRKIVEAQRDFWGELPYQHYTFFLLLGDSDARGGLEHRNSTSLLLPRWIFREPKEYERYLALVSHEFFHVWNVKRLRAAGLGPFDYSRETYTTLLWAMEGLTSYYTTLLLARAGLMTPERYLERLADDIVKIQSTPGRSLQSLECSSWDTWIKLYRPDENSDNTSISYYLKGAVVGALLDLELRRRTGNARSLDDVMRYLYVTYPPESDGIPDRESFVAAIRAVTGEDLSAFFARYIGGVDELPYDDLLGVAGLKLSWDWKDTTQDGAARPWLGARVKGNGVLKVTHVLRDSPAYASGISAGDEIIAVDGWRVTSDESLRDRLNDHRPGDRVTLLVARRDELRSYDVTLTVAPRDKLTIARVDQPDEAQRRVYASWLGHAD